MSKNNKRPWLNADGSLKSTEEIKSSCASWPPSIWEAYLSTLEDRAPEATISPAGVLKRESKLSAEELAVSIFDYISDSNEYSRFKDLVVDAMNRLSPRQLEVIRRIYWENKSQVVTAKELGISKSTVQVNLKRALEKLRMTISEMAIERTILKSKVS